MTAKAPCKLLHVASALRQRGLIVQHERHRLCCSHRLIPLDIGRSQGEVDQFASTIAVMGLMQEQRGAHDTTPVWIKPS